MPIKYIPPVKKENLISLDCDGDPHRLDVGDFTPTVAAVLFAGTYVNVQDFVLKSAEPARLQIWMTRVAFAGEPADPTFLNDLWLNREGYVHHDWETMFEKCEANRALRWYYQINGAKSVKIDTRYIKYALVW